MKRNIFELRKEILEFHYKRNKLVYKSDKKEKIETFVSKQDIFLKSDLFRDIIDSTQFLPNNVTIYHRIKAIIDGYENHPLCPICNKRKLRINKNFKRKLFSKNCGEMECNIRSMVNHIGKQSEKTKKLHRELSLKFQKEVLNILKDVYTYYNSCDFEIIDYEDIRNEIIKRKKNQKRNGKIITISDYKNNPNLVCSIIYHTSFIKTRNELEDLTNNFFKMSERTFCIYHGMREYNRCKECGSAVVMFDKNWKIGYRSVCSKPSCGTAKASKNRAEKNMIRFKDTLKENGYELLTGNKNKQGRGILRHSCGYEFEVDLKSIFLDSKKGNKNPFRNFDRLCPKCFPRENMVSRWEIEVRNFCSDICKNDSFRFNDREVLYPYEIDILDSMKNIGIECDGAAMHSDDRKDRGLHKWKTDECERLGIELVHFLDHEWYLKQETVKSIIMRKFGLINKVSNSECTTEIISEYVCSKFVENNNLEEYVQMKNNIGVFHNGDMIGCFSYEAESEYINIGNITLGNGYDIENIVELVYDIVGNGIIRIKEDRRLFQFRKNIEDSGFKLERRTKSSCLKINKILSHRAHDRYFEGMENTERNVYDMRNLKEDMTIRYFDCGNLVYVKRY